MDLSELYSQVIKDHNLSRHNRHGLEGASVAVPGKNPSCGDEIELFLKVKDGVIQDASYTGEGCAISQASVSIMIDLVRGKTPEEAAALAGVSNMPARVKCATMPWHTLEAALAAARGA